MSDVRVRAALETYLSTMQGVVDTAYENVAFDPVENTPYQRLELVPGEPENPTAGGDTHRRLLGFLQVTLMFPLNGGPGAAAAYAELLRARFPKGLSLTNGGVIVTIPNTPYVMGGFVDNGRWSLPVRISYFANITG